MSGKSEKFLVNFAVMRVMSKMQIQVRKYLFATLMLAVALLLSGCFFTEQTIVIGPGGQADVSVTFWFEEAMAGDQGTLFIQGLLFAFPELQNNYELSQETRKIEYSSYRTYTFTSIEKIGISENEYMAFLQKDDGSYYFEAKMPKLIEEITQTNPKFMVIKVTLPAEIDIANTKYYEGNTAEWELRQNDFTRNITLKAFTKPLGEKKTEQTEGETMDFSTPESTIRNYYRAVFVAQDESLAETGYSKKTSSLLVQTLRSPLEIKNQFANQQINFDDYVGEILAAEFSVDQEYSKGYPDPENEKLVTVRFDEKCHNWKVVREKGAWRIGMPVVPNEQGDIWLRTTAEIEPFFDLSAPENALRSFITAAMLKDKEQAQKCWFNKYLSSESVESFIDGWVKGTDKGHPEMSKFLVRATQYDKKKIDEDNYYVFTIPAGSEQKSKIIQCKVRRDGGDWKILMFKSMADNPLIRAVLAMQGIAWEE